MQALPAPAESLCIVEMGSGSDTREERGEDRGTSGGLFLNIGLQVNKQMCLKVVKSVAESFFYLAKLNFYWRLPAMP